MWLHVLCSVIPNTRSCDRVPCTVLFPIHSCVCMSCTVLFPIHRVVTKWHIQSYSEYTELWLSALYSLNTKSCDRVSWAVLFPIHTVVTECPAQSYSQCTQLWQSVFYSRIPNTHSCDRAYTAANTIHSLDVFFYTWHYSPSRVSHDTEQRTALKMMQASLPGDTSVKIVEREDLNQLSANTAELSEPRCMSVVAFMYLVCTRMPYQDIAPVDLYVPCMYTHARRELPWSTRVFVGIIRRLSSVN